MPFGNKNVRSKYFIDALGTKKESTYKQRIEIS